MEETWYAVSPGSEKLDLSNEKSYNAYFLDKNEAFEYSKPWARFRDIDETTKPNHLENLAFDENNNLKASFKFKSHAVKYNGEILNGKGHINENF